ncbi:MAG: hypothetical protein WCS70_16615 [Verrucomicrobiota bacterium]
MQRKQRSVTLGELIQAVAQYSRNDHEVGLVVADLLHRGVVIRARPAAVNAALLAAGRVRKL